MRKWIIPLICIAAFAAQACGPKLQAVREYSATTLAAAPLVKAAIEDAHSACKRRNSYLETEYEIDKAIAKKTNIPQPREPNYAKCDVLESSNKEVVRAYDVFLAYTKGMGTLAADDIITADTKISRIQDQLGTATDSKGKIIFKKDQVDAVASFAQIIINAALQGWQKSEINKYLGSSHVPIDTFLERFTDYLEYNTKENYSVELTDIETNYDVLIAKTQERSLKIELANTKKEKIDRLNKKIAALDNCVALMRTTRRTHSGLALSKDDLDADLLAHLVRTYYEKAIPAIDALEQAF